jgi:hypothetical protein
MMVHKLCILWETDVIAYANSDLAIFCVENGNLGRPCLHVLTFVEVDAPGDIYIEEMKLPMLSHDISFTVKAQTRVEDLLLTWYLLGERTTYYVYSESL